jgi:hypothetical protein
VHRNRLFIEEIKFNVIVFGVVRRRIRKHIKSSHTWNQNTTPSKHPEELLLLTFVVVRRLELPRVRLIRVDVDVGQMTCSLRHTIIA